MHLCFMVRRAGISRLEGLRECTDFLEIDYAVYVALQPFTDAVHRRTNQFIDYYGWAEFEGADLDIIAEELTAMKNTIDASTGPVVINMGGLHPITDAPMPEYEQLNREEVALILSESLSLVESARSQGRIFVCKGP